MRKRKLKSGEVAIRKSRIASRLYQIDKVIADLSAAVADLTKQRAIIKRMGENKWSNRK
jgi:hypothetical protein